MRKSSGRSGRNSRRTLKVEADFASDTYVVELHSCRESMTNNQTTLVLQTTRCTTQGFSEHLPPTSLFHCSHHLQRKSSRNLPHNDHLQELFPGHTSNLSCPNLAGNSSSIQRPPQRYSRRFASCLLRHQLIHLSSDCRRRTQHLVNLWSLSPCRLDNDDIGISHRVPQHALIRIDRCIQARQFFKFA